MQTTKQPYELLVRWDQTGALVGAHIQYRYVIEDAGRIIGESVGGAEPLTLGDFPLSDILSQAQADALAETERLRSELDAVRRERDDLVAEKRPRMG